MRGRIALFVPDARRPARLRLTLRVDGAPRSISLRVDGRPTARFEVAPGPARPFDTPPLRLDRGLHIATLAINRGAAVASLSDLAAESTEDGRVQSPAAAGP